MEHLDNKNYQLLKYFYQNEESTDFDLEYTEFPDSQLQYDRYEKSYKNFHDPDLQILLGKGFIEDFFGIKLTDNKITYFEVRYKITPIGKAFYEQQTHEIEYLNNKDQFSELDLKSYEELNSIASRNLQIALVKRDLNQAGIDEKFPEYVKQILKYDIFLEAHDFLYKNNLIELNPFFSSEEKSKTNRKIDLALKNPLGYIVSVSTKGRISLEKYKEKIEARKRDEKQFSINRRTFIISIVAIVLSVVQFIITVVWPFVVSWVVNIKAMKP